MRKFYIISLIFLLANCAHHKDVRPGTQGTHKVVVNSETEEQGQRNALTQADYFCKKRYEKVAAVQKEQTRYIGDMDEENYKLGQTASRVLKVGGTSAWIFGGKRESNTGKVATGTGSIVDSALGKGYQTQMLFQCI